jgi:hypothetical protein
MPVETDVDLPLVTMEEDAVTMVDEDAVNTFVDGVIAKAFNIVASDNVMPVETDVDLPLVTMEEDAVTMVDEDAVNTFVDGMIDKAVHVM